MELDCSFLPYRDTHSFSDLAVHYSECNTQLNNFYQYTPNLDGLAQAIANRKNYTIDRSLLHNALIQQYQGLETTELVAKNIEALQHEHSFTICTAHQPNLLTGYLYFFYKILHAIKMAETLNEQQTEHYYIPVYYMGSEDNDLAELGQFWYEAQQYRWDAAKQTGAVGRMNTASLKPLLADLFKRLGPPGNYCDELIELITNSYLQHQTIGQATLYLVNKLFGTYGLLVIDPDKASLKRSFIHILKDELLHQTAYPLVQEQSDKLSKKYKVQAYPRPINLFYLKDGLRERIEKQGEIWKVRNTNLQFSGSEIIEELNKHPERFSPNVILRGLFQEIILPNVAFIGGAAEIAYWLQLKPLFEHYKVSYPVLFLRQSVQIVSEKTQQLLSKLNLSPHHIFWKEEELLRLLITEKNGNRWNLSVERKEWENLLKKITNKASLIDPNLQHSAAAAAAKIQKQISIVESKIYRAEKRKESINAARINQLLSFARPNGGLQERVENFIPYYLKFGFSIFEYIKNQIRPFDQQFLIVHPSLKKD